MGACLSKASSPESTAAAPCPELPPEIVDLILSRLPDHGDRLSFGAVCHEWHLAARGLPPDMPCINLGDGTYQSLIGGGKVHRFPTPRGYHAGACFGGWIFYCHEGSGRCFLRRPFSGTGAAIQVPAHYEKSGTWELRPDPSVLFGKYMDMKMVVCSSRLVVAVFRDPRRGYSYPVSVCYLACFRPSQPLVWSYVGQPVFDYQDIAFYDGKVLALTSKEQLFCHGVDGKMNHHLQQPIVQHANHEVRPAMLPTNYYLVVSSDKQKLLLARWSRRRTNATDGHDAMDMCVFEADFVSGRWLEVKDLGGQVLFLGKNCSMAFDVGSTEHWDQRFRGGNRVFVLGTEWARSSGQPVSYETDGIPRYCVYDMVSGETSLVSLDGPRYTESCTSGWFFPSYE